MSKALGTLLGRPDGSAGATGATSLGGGLRARPVVGRRAQIDRADGSASARGKRAGDAAADRTKSLALGSGLARFGATHDRGVGTRSSVGHRRLGFPQARPPLRGGGAAIFGHAGQDGQLPSRGEPASSGRGRKYHPGLAALFAGKLDAGCPATRRSGHPRGGEVPDQVATGAGIDRRSTGVGLAMWGGVGGLRLRGSHRISRGAGNSPTSLRGGYSFHFGGVDTPAPPAQVEGAGTRASTECLPLWRAAAVRGSGGSRKGSRVEARALARRDKRLARLPLLCRPRPAFARIPRRPAAPWGGLAAGGMAA